MSNLQNIQRKLSEGISGWLLFEFHCLRGTLFNEKYLSFPIGQILNSVTDYKTLTEINHPYSNSLVGRPLQIDFVLIDNNSTWKYAFESKWVGNSTISFSAMIWDLIRLQNLFVIYPTIKCYFVIAGFDKVLEKLFRKNNLSNSKVSKQDNGVTTLNSKNLTFNLIKLEPSSKKYINTKLLKYQNFNLYSQINCKPAHVYPKEDITNMTFSTYVWEVLPPNTHLKISNL